MSAQSTITKISSCTTTACSFNNDGCTAFAVTIGANPAACTTFATLDVRGGIEGAEAGQVGACQRLECRHNQDLMCSAGAITIAGDSATCESYAAA